MADVSASNIRIGANIQGLLDGMKRASQAVRTVTFDINAKLADSYKRANKEQSAFRGGITKLGDDLVGLGQKMGAIGALPALFAAGKTYKDYADLQKLEVGLKRYGESLEGVRELAKLPNIGVFDGAKVLIGLRAVGVEADKSKRLITSFANAITEAGGSAEDLEPALVNIKQFLSTGNINQVDLRQLSARIPQINEALRSAFGSTDATDLNKLGVNKVVEGILTELEKLPPVAGGAGMAMDQAADSFTFFSASVGEAIDKSADITGKISAFGGFLDDLSTNFKSLNPEAQKAIAWIGGMAVAIPALTIAVGSFIKFIPLVTAGFGFATVPWTAIILGIAGVVTILGSLTAVLALAGSNAAEYNKQQELVAGFTGKLNPLVAEYEKLTKQTKLSKEEQTRLQSVTQELGREIPTAVTGWDNYGNAIDINAKKVKSYITDQQNLLKAMQATRKEELLTEQKRSDVRKTELQKILQSGKETKNVNLGMGVNQIQTQTLGNEDLRKYTKELIDLQNKDKANRKELLTIGGKDLYTKEAAKLTELKRLRRTYAEDYKAALKSENIALINSVSEKSRALDKEIADQTGRVRPLKDMVGLGSKESEVAGNGIAKGIEAVAEPAKLASLSIAKLEERLKTLTESYTALDPTAKDYKQKQTEIAGEVRQVTLLIDQQSKALTSASGAAKGAAKEAKEAGKYYKQMSELEYVLYQIDLASKYDKDRNAVKAATTEYKELVGVVANLNAELLKSQSATVGDSTYDGLEKAKQKTAGIADSRMSQTTSDINRSTANVYGEKNAQLDASLDAKSFLGDKKTLKEIEDFFATIPKVAGESQEAYAEKLKGFVAVSQELSGSLSASLREMAANVAVGFGEMLGDLASGVGGMAEFTGKLVGALAGMLREMGKAMIAAGTAGIAMKLLMKNPALTLAAGVALVAVGQVLSNSIQKSTDKASTTRFAKGGMAYREMNAIVGDNPNARFDPEMIAPYSKVDQSIKKSIAESGANGAGSGWEQVEIKVRGEDMYLVMQRVAARNKTIKRIG